ncbi:MAG: response regulator transcription factor [Saprospiraceae bacterium]|nr:response regulator transcription factor [Saprospiraceae bacterium]
MRAIIVEDDFAIALEYEMLLKKMKIDLIGTFKTGSDCLNAIKVNKPDFIILDLQLKRSESGIKLASKIQYLFIPFIIITGFPQKQTMLEANELNAVAYLTKPVNLLTLEFEINKIAQNAEKSNSRKHSILVKERGTFINVPHNNISFIEVEGNYATIHTNQKRYVLKKSLTKIWSTIDQNNFMKVHRGFIVNKEFIEKVKFGTKELLLNNGQSVSIGKNYFKELRDYLSSLNNI